MADELKATPVKREWALKLADALRSGREYANKLELPFFGGAGDFVLGKTPEGLERVAYDEPLTSGSGWTTRLRPETVDMGFTALDVLPVGKVLAKGLRKGTEAASTAAVRGITGNPNATPIGVIDEIQRMNLLPSATVWHGSPHTFEKFDLSKIGTGEGAQAYGHGLYFAESPEVAANYAPRNAKYEADLMKRYDKAVNAGQYDKAAIYESAMLHESPAQMKDRFSKSGGYDEAQVAKYHAIIDKELAPLYSSHNQGMYKVDLPDEQIAKMLDWDKPLSEQPESVRGIFGDLASSIAAKNNEQRLLLNQQNPERLTHPVIGKLAQKESLAENIIGNKLYENLVQELGGAENVSKYLNEQGIPGIQYLDQASRGTGEGTRNYVIFSDEIPQILERNGQPITQALRNYEAPQAQALREAEEYGQKMLGLPPGNTPMDRAMAGGYVEPNYHGALDASQNVLIPSKGGELGQGSYVTRSPELASEFARKQYGAPYQEGSGVFPLLTRKLEEIPRNQWVDTRLEEMNRLRSENKGEWSPEFYEQSMENMRKKTENAGNYGWYTPGEGGVNQGVVFDTGNMRSRFAAFDPRYFGKPGLMLGASGLGVYGALQGEDEYK